MKRFICRLALLAAAFAALNGVLLFAVPKDRNAFLCAYNQKIQLLEKVPQPRMIFVGGSSVAFGMDSEMLSDSLHTHIVNFGLHAGIGIRYPLEDCLRYVQPGDTLILQFEYANFFTGGNGDETLLSLMLATGWRNSARLNIPQWLNVLKDVPVQTIFNAKRLCKYPFSKSFNSPARKAAFTYVASGFNAYGDEVSHFDYPAKPYYPTGKTETRTIRRSFMTWLSDIIRRYEQAGATIVLLPPACIASGFQEAYNEQIEKALADIGHPYIVPPASMVLADSYTFDTRYHLNRAGCELNTQAIMRALRSLEEP